MTAYARSAARANSAIHPCSQKTTQYIVNTFSCHRSRVAEAQPEQAQQHTPVAKEQHIYHQYLAMAQIMSLVAYATITARANSAVHPCSQRASCSSRTGMCSSHIPCSNQIQHRAQATYSTVLKSNTAPCSSHTQHHAQIQYSTMLKPHTAPCSSHTQHHAQVTHSTMLKSHTAHC